MTSKKTVKDLSEIVVNTKALADLFGYSSQRINQLAQEGILEKKAAGRWPLMKNVQRFINYLRTNANDKDKSENQAIYWEEKALHERAKREIAEIELAKLKNRMHDAADVEYVMTNMLITFRNKILAMPEKLAPKVYGLKTLSEISEIIHDELAEALNELSEYDPVMFEGDNDGEEDDYLVQEDSEDSGSTSETND